MKFLLVALGSFFTNIIAIIMTKKLNIFLDTPKERSSHSNITPRIGGFGIYITLVIFFFFTNYMHMPDFILYSFPIFVIGLYDDFNEISNKIKLLELFIISFFMTNYLLGYYSNTILFIMFFIFLSIQIGFNFIDGLNGLSGLLAITTLIGLSFHFYKIEDFENVFHIYLIIAAIIGFLLLNIQGKIFLGDSGSMLIGFFIAYFSFLLLSKNGITITKLILLNGIYLFDLYFVVIYRLLKKKNPFKADKNHIHHIIKRKLNTFKTVLVLLTINFLLIYISF
jgi:UDP-N-acetylmuramyl pentapeptide phosphotransferase/UDP-N-acetylglucosamine-1-phosphate transferase